VFSCYQDDTVLAPWPRHATRGVVEVSGLLGNTLLLRDGKEEEKQRHEHAREREREREKEREREREVSNVLQNKKKIAIQGSFLSCRHDPSQRDGRPSPSARARLSDDAIALGRWRTWWRRIPSRASIRGFWALQMHTSLLAVVVLILATTIVPGVGVWGRVRRCRWCIVGLLGVHVGAGAGSPAGAVEGLATGLAATAGGDAAVVRSGIGIQRGWEPRDVRAQHEQEQEAEDYHDQNNPSRPVAPSRVATDATVIPIVVTAGSHDVLAVM